MSKMHVTTVYSHPSVLLSNTLNYAMTRIAWAFEKEDPRVLQNMLLFLVGLLPPSEAERMRKRIIDFKPQSKTADPYLAGREAQRQMWGFLVDKYFEVMEALYESGLLAVPKIEKEASLL